MKKSRVSNQTRNNWLIVFLLTVSGLLVTFSTLYFLFLPNGGYQGGRNPTYGIMILFTRTTWDLIHTWAGVVFIGAVVVHFRIHWQWIKSMTKQFFLSLLPQSALREAPAEVRI